MKTPGYILAFILSVAGAVGVHAQVQEQLTPAEQKKQTIVTQPITIQKGFIRAGANANYIILNKVFTDKGERDFNADGGLYRTKNAVSYRFEFPLAVTYGLTDRIQVSVSIPYLIQRRYSSFQLRGENGSDTASIGGSTFGAARKLTGDGWGDLTLQALAQILTEKPNRPAIAGGLMLLLPTGRSKPTHVLDPYNYSIATGLGETLLAGNLQIRKVLFPVSFSLEGAYQYSFGGQKNLPPFPGYLLQDPGFTQRSYFIKSPARVILQGTFNFHVNDFIIIGNTLMYNRIGSKVFKLDASENYYYEPGLSYTYTMRKQWIFEYVPTLSFQIKRYRFNQRVFLPLSGRNVGADPSYGISLEYTF